MARRGCLPFVTAKAVQIEEDLGNFLLGRTVADAVDRPQHALRSGALLFGQACVRGDGPPVKRGEKTIDGFEPIEPFDAERDRGRQRLSSWGTVRQGDLGALALAEIKRRRRGAQVGLRGIDEKTKREVA